MYRNNRLSLWIKGLSMPLVLPPSMNHTIGGYLRGGILNGYLVAHRDCPVCVDRPGNWNPTSV